MGKHENHKICQIAARRSGLEEELKNLRASAGNVAAAAVARNEEVEKLQGDKRELEKLRADEAKKSQRLEAELKKVRATADKDIAAANARSEQLEKLRVAESEKVHGGSASPWTGDSWMGHMKSFDHHQSCMANTCDSLTEIF